MRHNRASRRPPMQCAFQASRTKQHCSQEQMAKSNTLLVSFRGRVLPVDVTDSITCADLAHAVQQAVDQPLGLHTLRLLVPKRGAVQLHVWPNKLLTDAGVGPGSRCILLGSFQSELQALEASQQAAASLRLPDFDYEAQRAAARSSGTPGGSQGRHYFGSFKVLPINPFAPTGAPPPSAALALLHKLASDPAIADIMQRYGWSVPLLSEMPPEGLVGVSQVCILGYNVNKGQEISLRLRTDDYAGFRKYLAIRKTLVHELTHNVWSDHDINFKKLNSQLLKEVEAYEAAHASARTLAGIDTAYDPAAAQLQQQQQQPAKGRTLAGAVAAGQLLNHRVLPAPELARAAALARWQEQQQQQQQPSVPLADWQAPPTAAQPGVIAAAGVDTAAAAAGGQVVSLPLPDSNNGVPIDPDAAATAAAAAAVDLQAYEHEDAATAAAEAAADRLGSLQPGDDADWEPGLQLAGMGLEQPGMQQGPASLQPQQDTMVLDEQQQDEQLQQQQTQWQQQQQPMVGVSKLANGPVPVADVAAAESEAVSCSCCRELHSGCVSLQDDMVQQPTAAAAGHIDPCAAAVTAAAEPGHADGCSLPPLRSAAAAAAGALDEVAVPQLTTSALPTSPQEASVVTQQHQQQQQPLLQQCPTDNTTSVQGSQSQPEPVVSSPLGGPGSWAAEDAAAFEGLDAVLLGKLQQAGQLVQQLLQQSADSGQAPALQTLAGVLANLAEHPQDERFRRLRCSNAAFHRKLGRFPAARQLLLLAGFAEQQQEVDGSGFAEPVLVWVRRDVGLVWLVLSVVREALHSTS